MKRTVKQEGRKKYIIEEYNSFNELISTNDSREVVLNYYEQARDRENDSWCGASYENAVEMLRYGWADEAKIKAVADKIGQLEKLQDIAKMSFKSDIVGYAPIVPLALKGVPQNMINCTRKPKKAKVINLIIDIGVSGDISVAEKLEWGAKVLSGIIGLEKQGFRVRIDVSKVTVTNSQVHMAKVPIKNENQPFDIKRMMFPIAHAAMQRRIFFDWYERLPEAEYHSGHGYSLSVQDTAQRAAIDKNIPNSGSSYLICYGEDINDILKGVA